MVSPGRATARANSSGTLAAGEKFQLMVGEKLCRTLLASPKPGKNAKSVGDALAAKRNRFPCLTNAPPVLRFRTANTPRDVVLATPTTGWSFHDPRKRIGRLMPVSQSIPLSKSPRKVRVTVIESLGSGVLGSSTRKP